MSWRSTIQIAATNHPVNYVQGRRYRASRYALEIRYLAGEQSGKASNRGNHPGKAGHRAHLAHRCQTSASFTIPENEAAANTTVKLNPQDCSDKFRSASVDISAKANPTTLYKT